MTSDPFHLTLPRERRTCVVFSSPHSGRGYSAEFYQASVLDDVAIRSSEDAFVDVLFDAAPRFGAPFLAARVPRAYVDLNRSPEEFDPALIRGIKAQGSNPRISSGLGVIPRVVANGRAIYGGKISLAEAEARIKDAWHPFHDRLQRLLDESNRMFGRSILVDCHSMPHEALVGFRREGAVRPDVVLGDRFGAAACGNIVDRIEASFRNAGLTVARNSPFAGAYIAQTYGRPSRNQHVVQIEIDRSLYMDETRIVPNGNFDEIKALMTQIIAEIAAFGRGSVPLAAE